MKNSNLLFVAILSLGLFQSVNAQDNNDINLANHQLNINVPEIAILDIYDSNTGFEAGPIEFNMADATEAGVNSEAGSYQFSAIDYQGLYINYTSVVGKVGSGFDTTRQIDVQFEPGSTFPSNLDLRISPQAPVITANGGTVSSAGAVTAPGIVLGTTTPAGTDALLVNSIESVYTGNEAWGVKLAYTLEQNGNFAGYEAGLYQATLRYTLSDF